MTTTDPGVDADDGLFDLDDTPTTPEPTRRRRPGGARRPQPRRPRYRAPDQARPGNFYPDVAAFVAGFLAPTHAREWHDQDTERRWCSTWWLHTEAIVRLEALRKAWEVLRLDPAPGASSWLRDHADPAMAMLTSPAGTFARCKPGRHHTLPPLVLDPPPPGLLDDPTLENSQTRWPGLRWSGWLANPEQGGGSVKGAAGTARRRLGRP